jgi:putative transposase
LLGVTVARAKQAWGADITDVRLQAGFVYPVAVMDWCSRDCAVLGRVDTREVPCCLDVLDQALSQGQPEIFNTDQGAQFTSGELTARLQKGGVQISMDGRGRVVDNAFAERLWRTVKE